MNNHKNKNLCSRFSMIAGLSVCALALSTGALASTATATTSNIDYAKIQSTLAGKDGLPAIALKEGLNGFKYAKDTGHATRDILIIADLNMLSKKKRLWVINLKQDKIVFNGLVANGRRSGLYRGTYFSNTPRSLASSLGVYETGAIFYGNDGMSERLHGLEPGVNNNAYARDIVMHTAWYVTPSFVKKYGRTGRSWGCFAMDPVVGKKIMKYVQKGSVLFAYAPQEQHDPVVNGTDAQA